MDYNHHHQPSSSSTIQFQVPQFVLGGTPNLAHGGGAEVLPGMYGQGAQAWSDYDKYWYDNPTPSKYYSLADLVADPSPSHPTPRPTETPRPFEFNDSPHEPHEADASATSSPALHPIDLDDPPALVPSQPYPPLQIAAPFAQYPALAMPTFTFPTPNVLDPTAPLPPLPPNGLPLYSATGFDMLRMLGKVAARPHPKIMLGPVDMTCSFVVVDVRRFDAPIVYASPTFSRLTGYSETEVLGRNCRFLQAPSGHVERGDERRYTAPDAVRHMQKCLLQEKECQASLINYRKDGGAFINLVTVIPVAADDASDEVTHHVGFQVDLAEQPNAILQKLRDGSYIVNYSSSPAAGAFAGGFGGPRERRSRGVSQAMSELLRARRPWTQPGEPGAKPERDHERAELHALLLENTDDFIHVVSLKGSLLYVAPSVQRVLGYDPAELVGKSIADLCHPADIVPLMRELKEASAAPTPDAASAATPSSANATSSANPDAPAPLTPLFVLPPHLHTAPPKTVSLLFRAQHKDGAYVWLEARGRLHVEQGKGRKAVVLVGRRTSVPRLRWRAVQESDGDGRAEGCWGLVAPNGIVLSAGARAAERLGYADDDDGALVGRTLASLVAPEESRRVGDVLAGAACADRAETRSVRCEMRGAGARVRVEVVFYACEREREGVKTEVVAPRAPSLPASLVFQIRFLGAGASPASDGAALEPVVSPASASSSSSSSSSHTPKPKPPGRAPDTDVLEELATARETSWQYELTRLRFENERMRDEVGRLARVRRTQGQMPYLRRHLAQEPAIMASLPLLHPHPQPRPQPRPRPYALPVKRLRDGGAKLSPT